MKLKESINGVVESVKASLADRKNNLILYLAVIILINAVAVSVNYRIDLTANKVFSLSAVSKNTVKNITDPFIVKVFFSKDLPVPYNSVEIYIQDLLQEYKNNSKNFSYEIINIDEETNKNTAESFGIYPIQITERASDQIKARSAYMGMVLLHGDASEKIDNITTSEGLEYRITTTIQKMADKTGAFDRLKSPLTVTLYASDSLAKFKIQGFSEMESAVKALFDKINKDNSGKLMFNVIRNLDLDKVKETSAKYGMREISWETGKDAAGTEFPAGSGIMGIVLESGGKFQTIPFGVVSLPFIGNKLVGVENLEDKMKGAVDYIVSNNPKVGYITGHGELSMNDTNSEQSAAVFKQLNSDMYQFEEINLKEKDIPLEMGIIIINGPKEQFADSELFKIDQFIMKGGSVFFMVDKFNEVAQQNNNPYGGGQPMYFPVNTGLEKLLDSYGITVKANYILDKDCFVSKQQGYGEMPLYFAPLPSFDSFNSENEITKYLKKMVVLKVSSVEINEESMKTNEIRSTVLLKSSPKAWLMEGMINLNPMMMQPVDDEKLSRYNIAVLAEGKFSSPFNGVEPVSADNNTTGTLKGGEALKKGVKEAKIIVIGSSSLTTPELIDAEGKTPNSIFMHNIVDYLNNNTDMPQMRSKGLDFNPLKEMSDLNRLLFRLLNLGVLPVLVLIFGLLVWRIRIIRKRRIQRIFSKEVNNG